MLSWIKDPTQKLLRNEQVQSSLIFPRSNFKQIGMLSYSLDVFSSKLKEEKRRFRNLKAYEPVEKMAGV